MRHHPLGVHRVAGEAATELVVDAPAGHRLRGALDRPQGRSGRRPLVGPQQSFEQHRRRELGRPAEPAVIAVLVAQHVRNGTRQERDVDRRPTRGQGAAAATQLRHHRRGCVVHITATTPPRVGDCVEQLHERRHPAARFPRVVRTAVERRTVRGEEARHGPAALPRHRDRGVHVDGVEVGPLLAVDLDAHEVLVHHGRRRVVLERLVRHDMAPVAGRIADGQQDRHVPLARPRQRVRSPLVPVDRVVGVLPQIRAGRLAERVALTSPRRSHDAP